MEKFFRKRDISPPKFDVSNLKLPKISLNSTGLSSTLIQKNHSERIRFNSALKYLDIKLNPSKTRNPFKKTPQTFETIQKPLDDSFEDKDFEYIIEALLFNKPNQFFIQSEKEKPLDLLKAEIELSKLKKRKKIFIGEVEEYRALSPLEQFWKENVSQSNTVRWDIFEEAFIEQFLVKIDINKGLVRKINWNWLLRNMIKKLSNKSTEMILIPGHPAMEPKIYDGLVVNYKNFESFVNRGKLIKLMERAVGFDTYYLVERFKKDSYVYACGTEYKGAFKGFKKDGDGKLIMIDKTVYEGMFFNGSRHGFGKIWASGCSFYGFWELDFMNGLGELNCSNGSRVEGVWNNGVLRSGKLTFAGGEYSGYMNEYGFNGLGTFLSKTGEVKKGIWVIGKLEGPGEQVLADGTILSGSFHNDMLEGEGTIKCQSYTYTGNLVHSKPLGLGTMVFKDGSEYKGQFENGNMNGKGVLVSKHERLVGEFVEGKLSGKGEKYFKDIYDYVGEFYDSMMHGEGSLNFKIDKVSGQYKGFFKFGKFKGYGELAIHHNDSIISVVSTWANEKFAGNVEIKSDGFVFRAKIVQDLPFYVGSVWFDDGGSYSGEWEREKPHGRGEARDGAGAFVIDLFQNGLPTGKNRLDASIFENLENFYLTFKSVEGILSSLAKIVFVYIFFKRVFE